MTFVALLLSLLTITACVPAQHQTLSSTKNSAPIEGNAFAEAEQYFSARDYAKASSLYKASLASSAQSAELQFKYAESLRLEGKLTEAIAHYQKAMNLNNNFSPAKEGLALAYLQQGDLDASKKLFLMLLEEDASRWRTLNALGVLNALQANKQDAVEYFELASAIAPEEPSILNNIGLSLALTEPDSPDGIEMLQQASRTASNSKDKQQIDFNLALAYGLAAQDEKAQLILKEHLSEAAIYNNLGVYASLRNDKKLAHTYLSKALTAKPVFYEKAWENKEKL